MGTLNVPVVTEFALTDKSQMLLDGNSAGAIAAFALPGNRGSLDIKLETFVSKELQFYAPNVAVMNSAGETIYQADFSKFKYEPAKLLDNDKFVLDLNVIPDMTGNDLHVLVYTTSADLKGSTQVLHPAKAFAMRAILSRQILQTLSRNIAHWVSSAFRYPRMIS